MQRKPVEWTMTFPKGKGNEDGFILLPNDPYLACPTQIRERFPRIPRCGETVKTLRRDLCPVSDSILFGTADTS